MISLCRPAYYRAYTTPMFAGLSTDTKPVNVPNGSRFTEIDTSILYFFDKTTESWVAKTVHSWGYPIKSYDSLLISQVYSVIQDGYALIVEYGWVVYDYTPTYTTADNGKSAWSCRRQVGMGCQVLKKG